MSSESTFESAANEALTSPDVERPIRFLLFLAHELTMAARETYEIGNDGVQRPSDLRLYNEVLHRVVANVRDLIEHRREDVWCWDLVLEASQVLPSIRTACRRALGNSPTC